MMNDELCERCDGSGVDPLQAFHDDEISLCVECRGDGVLVTLIGRSHSADGAGPSKVDRLLSRTAA